MKIIHIVFNLIEGGVSTQTIDIANEQAKSEDVRLIILDDLINEDIASRISTKCKVLRINRRVGVKSPLKLLPIVCKLNYYILRFNPDVIHLHEYKLSRLLFWKGKIVCTVHGNICFSNKYHGINKFYAISGAVSNYMKQQSKKSIIVPNGIRTKDIRKKMNASANNYTKPKLFHLIQIGRLFVIDKGQDIMLDAIRLLKEKGIDNFKMHFVGSGPSESMLLQRAKDYNIEDVVIFEGNKPQDFIYQHLCYYDCLIQPSRQEGFGLTIFEEMAAYVPVLISDLEGPMEVIGDGQYGMTFQAGNAIDLANKLTIILRGEYDYSLIGKAYKHACEEYDISKTAARYIEEYRKVISGY